MKKSKKEINRCALIFFLLLFLGDWFAAIIKVDILLRHFHVIMVLLNVCDALLLKNTESLDAISGSPIRGKHFHNRVLH